MFSKNDIISVINCKPTGKFLFKIFIIAIERLIKVLKDMIEKRQ